MLNIIVACANGAGTSLMLKMKVQKIMKDLGINAKIHHCSISEGKGLALRYDLVFTSLNFVNMFDSAKEKGVTVIGIKNVMSEKEVKEKFMETELYTKMMDK